MRILLRVEQPDAGQEPTDVVVDVAPSHTVGELAAALAAGCGTFLGSDRSLVHQATGRLLPAEVALGEAGIVSGDIVQLGGHRSGDGCKTHADPGGTGLHLVVTSGVDAGRSHPLVPGSQVVGRDPATGLRLTDPQISRRDFTVTVTGVAMTVDPGTGRTNELRLNGSPLPGPAALQAGDVLQAGTTTFRVRSPMADRRQPQGPSGTILFERTPQFHQPVEARVFEPLGRIPVRPDPRRFQFLTVIAPLALGLAMAYLFDSPRYLLFAVLSPVVGVGNYIDSRRSGIRRYRRDVAELRERLAGRRRELEEAMEAERRLRHQRSPDPVELVQAALTHHKALWNRTRRSPDFLELRAGLGLVATRITIRPETQGDEDLRLEAAEVQGAAGHLADVPVTIDLAGAGVVAAVGTRAETTSFATALAVQAACLHSPEDLVIVSATGRDRGLNRWLKWLPHTRSNSSPLGEAHLAGDHDSAERLLREVSRVVETRAGRQEQRLDLRWPWILLIVDRSLDPDPSILARLLDLGPAVGLSVVWLTDSDRHVPRQATVVARLRGPGDGLDSRLVAVEAEVGTQDFEPVRIGSGLAERAARALAPLLDASAANAAAAVPATVTLFEALGVERVDPAWVAEQWLTDRGYALPAPVGLTDTGPLVLDLVRHGPHGLIGGTSGAGKSELVQSMVATLVALSSPERVNLLFVDYKGGALSGLFAGVPHCVGAVTNLDALLSLRALTSLKAELDRRMALFERHRVKDIRQMLELHPAEAPASLVIVVDEFAALVRELPDFVDGIVSIAERGRSLGIHLLLSTQRPSGSINENIQQNTNLRLALRMLDGGESNNVIGTPAAATIPAHLKGRGFARLGPGQLIPFQAAWSGAPLGGDQGPRPVTVAPFTAPGEELAALLSSTLSGPPRAVTAGSGPGATELDALLAAVAGAARNLAMGQGRAPWKETLPGLIPLDQVLADPRSEPAGCPRITIGMIDNPEAQDQYPATMDLADGGGLAVFGCGGSGKTTTLITAACSAAIRDSQGGGGQLTIFGLDFGSRQLGVLNRLPQCETVASGEDLEAVTRVAAVLSRVFADRQLAVAAAADRGRPAPSFSPVLLVIDGFDSLAEVFAGGQGGTITVMQPWFDRITRLVTQGRQVGIHTVLGSATMTGLSGRLMSSISSRITLRQTDDNTYRAFGVPAAVASGLHLEAGQALTRTGELMQIAVAGQRPATGGGNEVDPAAVGVLADGLVGSVDPECRTPALPEAVGREPAPTADLAAIGLGVADLTLAPATVDLTANTLCVLGPPRSGRSTALLTVAEQLEAAGAEVWAFGPAGSPLASRTGWAGSAFGRASDLIPMLEQLAVAVELFAGVTRFLIVDDADRFDDMSLNAPLKALVDAGVRVCGSATSSRTLMGSNPVHRELKAARTRRALRADDDGAIQSALGARYGLRPGLAMVTGRGVLVSDGLPTVIQVYRGLAPASLPAALPGRGDDQPVHQGDDAWIPGEPPRISRTSEPTGDAEVWGQRRTGPRPTRGQRR